MTERGALPQVVAVVEASGVEGVASIVFRITRVDEPWVCSACRKGFDVREGAFDRSGVLAHGGARAAVRAWMVLMLRSQRPLHTVLARALVHCEQWFAYSGLRASMSC